jgi:hypothetical protein
MNQSILNESEFRLKFFKPTMNCKICKIENNEIFKWTVLWKYNVSYFHCENCWFLQTEEPYWLEECYNSPIDSQDTWILIRNSYLSKITSIVIKFFFDSQASFLDYAWGFWIFTRIMRDIWFDYYWTDKYASNLLARWFEYSWQNIELISTFESFEHFVEPLKDVENILKISKNILFTTELLPNHIPKPDEWWYYWLAHWQHVSFYSTKTLFFIANKYHLNFYSNWSNIHLLTNKKR